MKKIILHCEQKDLQKSCQQNSRTSLSSIYELHEVLESELNVAYSLPFTVSFRFISFHISLCSAWEAEATDRLEVASLETCVLISFGNLFFRRVPQTRSKGRASASAVARVASRSKSSRCTRRGRGNLLAFFDGKSFACEKDLEAKDKPRRFKLVQALIVDTCPIGIRYVSDIRPVLFRLQRSYNMS